MLRMPKTISALALGVALSGASVIPAHALSLIQPAYEPPEQAQNSNQHSYPASAFAAGKGEEATSNGYALSQAGDKPCQMVCGAIHVLPSDRQQLHGTCGYTHAVSFSLLIRLREQRL